jgi:hypothetical protein
MGLCYKYWALSLKTAQRIRKQIGMAVFQKNKKTKKHTKKNPTNFISLGFQLKYIFFIFKFADACTLQTASGNSTSSLCAFSITMDIGFLPLESMSSGMILCCYSCALASQEFPISNVSITFEHF